MATIVAIDDDPEITEYLTDMLENSGHTVYTANNGGRGVELICSVCPDLVLLDVSMPGMNGYEVLQQIRANPDFELTPAVFLSGEGDVQHKLRGFDSGAIDYIQKPFSGDELTARLRTHLGAKQAFDEVVAERQRTLDEYAKTEALVERVFPKDIAAALKSGIQIPPKRYEQVVLIISDVVGFTAFSDKHEPEDVIRNIQQMNHLFDTVIRRYGFQKINAVGDEYLAAGGLSDSEVDVAFRAVQCGLELTVVIRHIPARWNVRVGIHQGPVVGGVVGAERSLFGLYGDTVNTVARIQTVADPGSVCVSMAVWQLVRERCVGHLIGPHHLKGKGQLELFQIERLR